jgi:hypothetical protein
MPNRAGFINVYEMEKSGKVPWSFNAGDVIIVRHIIPVVLHEFLDLINIGENKSVTFLRTFTVKS